MEKGKVPMEKATQQKSISEVAEALKGMIADEHPNLGLDVICSPFAKGVRVMLVKVMPRGIYPVATACSSFEAPLKDIVHGLWGTLEKRGADEIKHLRGEAKKARLQSS